MKKLILPGLITLFLSLFILSSFSSSAFAFLGLGEGSSEFDCQKFWESFSEEDQLAFAGTQQLGSKWQLASDKNILQKKNSDYCELKGQQFDTDSEGELRNGFEIKISYFQNQEEVKNKIDFLKSRESPKVDDKNISGNTYSMRTLNVRNEEGGWTTLLPGNYGRTVGRVGNCVVSLTQTWYALAGQFNTEGKYDKQAGLMDIIMEGTRAGWRELTETKKLQQFCGGKAESTQTGQESNQPQQPQSSQTSQPVNKENTPFNFFGINPFRTWLNLVELAQARAFIGTGGLERFTETTILHGIGKETSLEKDARKMEEINKFYDQASERFLKLKGKTEWTEIDDTTKKLLIETATDPVTLKKDSSLIDLQPHGGEKGILETGDKPMLKSGAIDVIIEPQNGKQFEIQTPNTEIFVIGTEFSVIYNQKTGETWLAVYKGKVEIKTNDGKIAQVSPDGNKSAVVVVVQKLSVTKLAVAGLISAALIGGVILILKRRFAAKGSNKKKK